MTSPAPTAPQLSSIHPSLGPGGKSPDQPPPPHNDETTGADRRSAARILVVEDDWFAAMEIERSLREAGYDVLEVAASAAEAIEFARDEEPELVIMDIRLVGQGDGIDAAIEIRRRFDIPALFVTAHDEAALRSRAAPARALGWLTKPLLPDELTAAVRAALERK
jgi:DNA-binding response OmpR family regulator